MPFFIKRKKSTTQKPQIPKKKFKKAEADEESIDSSDFSDDEGAGSKVTENGNALSSDESDESETEEDKKLRLAKKYLKEIRSEIKQRSENCTAEEVEASIEERLKEDCLKKTGKLRKSIGDKFKGVNLDDIVFLKCKEQKRAITCICVSPDDQFIYSGSKDGTIVKWSIMEKKKVGSLLIKGDEEKHAKSILCLAVSSDGKFLAVGNEAKEIHVLCPENLKPVHCFKGHRNSVLGLAFRNDTHTLFSCSKDRTVKVWSVDEMMYVETLFGHLDSITSIDALIRDRAVTSGGADNTVRIWKITEETQLIYNSTNNGNIDVVKLMNEDHFVTGDSEGSLCIWGTGKKKPLYSEKHAHGCDSTNSEPYWICSVGTLRFTDIFASGSQNGFVYLWKVQENFRNISLLFKIPIKGFVNSLAFTSDGSSLIAGVGREHKLGRWKIEKDSRNGIYIIPLSKTSQ